MVKTKISENDIQRQIVDWIRAVAPSVTAIAVPNGARRTAGGRPANAVPGLTPGVPDLVVIKPKGEVLWLEVKSPIGKVSNVQFAFHDRLLVLGHMCAVVRSIDDVRIAFNLSNIPIKEA